MQEFIVAVASVFIVSIIISMYQSKKRKKRLISSIKKTWGKLPENEFDEIDLKNFSQLFRFRTKKKSDRVIDDTTWDDLEMDSYFELINGTSTSMGDNVLYSILRTPLYSKEQYQDRVELIDYWAEHQEERERIQILLANAGKFRPSRLDVLVDDSDFLEIDNKWLYKVLAFMPILAIPILFINIGFGMFWFILAMGINAFYHEKKAVSIHSGLEAIIQATRIVILAKTLCKNRIQKLKDKFDKLYELYKTLKPILSKGSLNNFIAGFSGDMVSDSISLLNMVFLIDIWNYQSSIKFLNEHHEELAQLIEAIGEIDATISIASYRESLDLYCKPEIMWDSIDKSINIDAKEVIHPLIQNCTPNPVYSSKPTLLTGSNASGKSTYLKTIAINTILAHTLGFCLAEKWISRPLFPITSMALKDSVLNGESYFIAEIKSLKRIFSMVNSNITCLCIIDEVLRGTNTVERIAASSRLLYHLAQENTCIFAATHDVELTHILDKVYENKHFEEEITDDDIKFDYKIKVGRATSRNAIKLLKIMGFKADIVSEANKAVEVFEKQNRWTNSPNN
ncbi:MAG: DNA mismatch repair protein MutS [Clostridiaceae bacterium]|jgi:DNA mismatch repair ATPase MutS|nr:DNA mismatch repair protein MutS [Clostridiaceae bacterium]